MSIEEILARPILPKGEALLKALQVVKMEEPGMYLHLYHGRQDPDEDMDDWGSDGPIFGPLRWVSITYMSDLRFQAVSEDLPNEGHYDGACATVQDVGGTIKREALFLWEDMFYYDGLFYGDFSLDYHPGPQNR